MPLTEEAKARIEENRRKALEKRNKGGGVASALAPKAPNTNQAQANNNAPRPTKVGSNSNSFYGNGSAGRKKLSGACSLSSAERFDIKIGYHEAVVAAVKAMASCRYDAKERTWSLRVDDHDEFMRSVEALKPDVAIERLPPFVVRIFSSSSSMSSSSKSSKEDESPGAAAAAADAVGPALWASLMPFQRVGVSFALVSRKEQKGEPMNM